MRLLIFIFFFIGNTFYTLSGEDLIVYPKKGIGEVRLGRTSEVQLKKMYGANYQLESDTLHHYVNYPELGLKFQFNNDNKLIRIIALSNFKGRTQENISPNKSTMGETLKHYGKPMLVKSKEDIHYLYKGIAFVTYCNTCDELNKEEINALPIQEIYVAKTVKLPPLTYVE